MRVLMQGRPGLLSAPGGDRIQVENTASELRQFGVAVDVADYMVPDLSTYDIVHIFQLDWTPETYFYIRHAKKQNKKIVFSPIHHKISEVKRFDEECVYDYRRITKYLFKSQFARDNYKNFYRSLFNPSKLFPTIYATVFGLKKLQIEELAMSDVLLVQTELEMKDLIDTYGVQKAYYVIPNGVGEQFLSKQKFTKPLNFDDYILSVGRIEPRKNQLNIIKAVKMLREDSKKDFKLVLIGVPNPRNHFEYTLHFKHSLKQNPWVLHIPGVPYTQIPSYFAQAKVCVSASWFETTGLTLIEALFCGTNAVATSPRAREMLGDLASYCDPGNVQSIAQAINTEYYKPRPVLPEYFREEYTWKNVAKKTLAVYEKLLA